MVASSYKKTWECSLSFRRLCALMEVLILWKGAWTSCSPFSYPNVHVFIYSSVHITLISGKLTLKSYPFPASSSTELHCQAVRNFILTLCIPWAWVREPPTLSPHRREIIFNSPSWRLYPVAWDKEEMHSPNFTRPKGYWESNRHISKDNSFPTFYS